MAALLVDRSCSVPTMPINGALKTSAASHMAWAISSLRAAMP